MTSLLHNTRRYDVSFRQNGEIYIKAHIAKQLSLKDGDVINVLSHKGEYMLYVIHKAKDIIGKHEGVVHPTKRYKLIANNLRAYSRNLTKAIFEVSGREGEEILKLHAGEPVDVEGIGIAIPLITRNPL